MNLPNKLTVLRIILIPFMMFFYLASFIPFGIGNNARLGFVTKVVENGEANYDEIIR